MGRLETSEMISIKNAHASLGHLPRSKVSRSGKYPFADNISSTGFFVHEQTIAEMEEDCASLEAAIEHHRKVVKHIISECFPLFEKKIKQSDEDVQMWKERALKAEGRVTLLERQLEERNNQACQLKSSYEGQYLIMMKTGAVLGEVVWKSFKSHANVKMLVQAEETMDKYCALSKGVIDSFLQAYRIEMPPPHSLEHVFVISVLGALTNFAAFTEGRMFLAKEDNGLQLLKKLLIEQEHWNVPQGRYMKRMVLTFAYNMTLVDNVAYFVLSEEKLLNAVLKCLGINDPTDVVGAAVAIIYRLVSVSLEAGIPSALPEKIPWALIKSMTTSPDPQLGEISNSLLGLMETTVSFS
ncbi:uncharacterized protein LOC131285721 [Anopheles ziemanni]|uniref:uncharacterized protein LOC131268708 n=1 Tax=Anopheles coustani TaxID=139045 RepID=UPI00265AA56A|nr:uncharacterized protein LOC131268708 [Anopheles coustani]XP_058170561.1 uncharacterized protein LOC131285721 [Anopheles ziemanni]